MLSRLPDGLVSNVSSSISKLAVLVRRMTTGVFFTQRASARYSRDVWLRRCEAAGVYGVEQFADATFLQLLFRPHDRRNSTSLRSAHLSFVAAVVIMLLHGSDVLNYSSIVTRYGQHRISA